MVRKEEKAEKKGEKIQRHKEEECKKRKRKMEEKGVKKGK